MEVKYMFVLRHKYSTMKHNEENFRMLQIPTNTTVFRDSFYWAIHIFNMAISLTRAMVYFAAK